MSNKLDSIDKIILKSLQEEGRLSNVELAKRCDMSAPPCLRRLRNLEKQGIIQGYHADLSSDALGFGLNVFVYISLEGQSAFALEAFESHIKPLDYVRECYRVTGEVDYILKVVAKSWEDYEAYLVSNIINFKGIKSVKTQITMKTTKKLAGVPVED